MLRHARTSTTLTAAALFAATLAAPVGAQEQAITHTTNDDSLQWGDCPAFMPEGCRIAVLHGDPTEPNADIFYQVPGGAKIARHWHESPERMVLVTGELQVTYDGQDPAVLNTGAYAYGPARKPHSATCLSSEPCTLFIAFVDPIDAMAGAPE
ncbi:cupin domain-containing protein [bacterium]|nr:cupin domain-containing protein [bacterium]